MPTLTPLPTAPARSQLPAVFVQNANAMMAALPTFQAEMNAVGAETSSFAAGGAFSIPYRFSASGQFPAASGISFSHATQVSSTAIYLHHTSLTLQDVAGLVAAMGGSSSIIKGHIRISKTSNLAAFMVFQITSVVSNGALSTLNGAVVQVSSTNPFTLNDSVVAQFQRTGDVGTAGIINRRVATITSTVNLNVDCNSTDMYTVTAQAGPLTFLNPVNPSTGSAMLYRVRDNGTARALSFVANLRGSAAVPLPTTTTVGATLYMYFIHNQTEGYWDLMASHLQSA